VKTGPLFFSVYSDQWAKGKKQKAKESSQPIPGINTFSLFTFLLHGSSLRYESLLSQCQQVFSVQWAVSTVPTGLTGRFEIWCLELVIFAFCLLPSPLLPLLSI
jgi:hypothetical protein